MNKYASFIERFSLDNSLTWSLEDSNVTLKWIRGDGWFIFKDQELIPHHLSCLEDVVKFNISLEEVEEHLISSCVQEVIFASLVIEEGKNIFGSDAIDTFLDVFKKHNNSKLRLLRSPEEDSDED